MTRFAAAALAALLPLAALAEERATTKEAEGMVKSAVAFMKKEGKEKALAAFSDPKGSFVFRDLYVVAYDLQGKCLAHGKRQERIGKDLIEEKDADGKPYIAERVKLAKEQGKGWLDYRSLSPSTQKVELKAAYCELVEGAIVCAHAYRT